MKTFKKKYYSFKEAEEDLRAYEPDEEYLRDPKSLLRMKLFWKNIKSTRGNFNARNVRYVVMGAFAVILYGYGRTRGFNTEFLIKKQ